MEIEYVTGDLMEAPEKFIVHGCNAQGVMGSGVAKLIREKYPTAFRVYVEAYRKEGLQLGKTIWVKGVPHTVINAITQEFYGTDRMHADYDAIRSAMRQINATAKVTQEIEPARNVIGLVDRVAMPLIGAGLAGGSWKTISAIIEEVSTHFQPVVYLIDGVIPES